MNAERSSLFLPGIFLLLFFFFGPVQGLAESLEVRQVRGPFPGGAPVRFAYGDGIFVAAGESGSLYTSYDGEEWKERVSATDRTLRDVTYGGEAFVAVGEGGTILFSRDGLTWVRRDSGTGYGLNGVGYGLGIFAAVGEGGVLLTSPDGLAWSAKDSGTHQGLNKIAFGKNLFVAVGRNGTLIASPDGDVWTPEDSGTHGHLDGIAYGQDAFVAAGETVLTSPDGKTWAERTAGTRRLWSVAFGGGRFAAVADHGGILTSRDGSEWTALDPGTRLALRAISHGRGMFLATGERGVLLRLYASGSPQISVSSASLNFGSVSVGNSSSSALTVANSGSADLVIRQISISGASAVNFTTQNDRCTGTTLSPSQNCSLQVVFSPNSTGSKSANLSISSNDPATPSQTVSLSGSGTASDGSLIIASGGSGGFCFISASVKGTGLEDSLDVLRKFRDAVLSKNHWGRKLVDFYYRHTPAVNRLLAGHYLLRKAVAFGMVPPLAAFAHVALHASPAEQAVLLLLLPAGVNLARRLIRSPENMRLSRKSAPGSWAA